MKKKDRIKISQHGVTRVAHALGLHGNDGLKTIARAVSKISGVAPPISQQDAKRIIKGHPDYYGLSDQHPLTKTTPAKPSIDPNSEDFLRSYEWRKVRMVVLKRDGARCRACGATPADGIRVNVDHIKPRRRFPGLALDETNLQVLCEDCNHGKGSWDMTDWREQASNDLDQQAIAHLRVVSSGGK